MPISLGSARRSELWRRPPWRSTKPGGGYQMGLTPVALAQWLPRAASAAEFERKVGLMHLSRLPQPVYQSLPASEAVQRQAANFVMAHLLRYKSGLKTSSTSSPNPNPNQRLRPDLPPLVEAALQVPDDLCLLSWDEQTQQFQLVAACLCSPSYWALGGKLGLPLSAIHEPVPGLNAQLGPRMQRFFLQMPLQRCFVRRNFFVHAEQELYQPKPDATDYGQVSGHNLMLRCERQGLIRLDHNLVLFSIRVDLAPLAEARYWPEQALALHRVLENFSETQQLAFGGREKTDAVLRYLASLLPPGVEPQG